MPFDTIESNFVKQWGDMLHELAEKRGGLFAPATIRKPVTGEAWTVERLGSVEAQKINTRFDPMLIAEVPTDRRWGYIEDFDVATMHDRKDDLRLVLDPRNQKTRRLVNAILRARDRSIIVALDGTVRYGKNAEFSSPFPAGQHMQATGAGGTATALNFGHLLDMKAKMLKANTAADPSVPVYVSINADVWRGLLEDARLTNHDYVSFRALEDGQLSNRVMGFVFIRTELVPDIAEASYNSNADGNRVFMWTGDAIEHGTAREVELNVSTRNDLRGLPWQAYVTGSWGATRVEDERVVRIISKKWGV